MPAARLLNEINKIRETELFELPFFFRYKHITSPYHLLLAQSESFLYWLRGNFYFLVCFDLLVERNSFVCNHHGNH